MCMLCGQESTHMVKTKQWNGQVYKPFKVYLCDNHTALLKFLLEYDKENRTIYAMWLLGKELIDYPIEL